MQEVGVKGVVDAEEEEGEGGQEAGDEGDEGEAGTGVGILDGDARAMRAKSAWGSQQAHRLRGGRGFL